MCCLSLSLWLFSSLLVSTRQSEKQFPGRVTFRPVRFISATSIRPLKSLSVVASTEVSGSGDFCFYLTCVISFWGSESECVHKSSLQRFTVSPSLCLYASQGRERVCQWGIKSRYPRYPHQSACYYFIRLISGCLTPPSFSPVRPSAAEFLISVKTMACLSCRTK